MLTIEQIDAIEAKGASTSWALLTRDEILGLVAMARKGMEASKSSTGGTSESKDFPGTVRVPADTTATVRTINGITYTEVQTFTKSERIAALRKALAAAEARIAELEAQMDRDYVLLEQDREAWRTRFNEAAAEVVRLLLMNQGLADQEDGAQMRASHLDQENQALDALNDRYLRERNEHVAMRYRAEAERDQAIREIGEWARKCGTAEAERDQAKEYEDFCLNTYYLANILDAVWHAPNSGDWWAEVPMRIATFAERSWERFLGDHFGGGDRYLQSNVGSKFIRDDGHHQSDDVRWGWRRVEQRATPYTQAPPCDPCCNYQGQPSHEHNDFCPARIAADPVEASDLISSLRFQMDTTKAQLAQAEAERDAAMAERALQNPANDLYRGACGHYWLASEGGETCRACTDRDAAIQRAEKAENLISILKKSWKACRTCGASECDCDNLATARSEARAEALEEVAAFVERNLGNLWGISRGIRDLAAAPKAHAKETPDVQ